MKSKISINDVEIDVFTKEDVPFFASYWCDTPDEFWKERGIELNSSASKEELEKKMTNNILEGSYRICTIKYSGHRIGVHTLTHMEEKSAMMHAHFWDSSFHGRGIATISYVKAMEWFMENNELEMICFHTPKKNKAPNRVKEKLGIPILKEVLFKLPMLKYPVPSWYSEVKYENLPRLKKRLIELYK
jgi:RimJ/RimL family protein N-acetyltransferase